MEALDQPLDRALAVMSAVAAGQGALSVTEIAQHCQLPVPTVHRIVAQLEQRDLLKRAWGTKKLLVGAQLVRLGAAAVQASMRFDGVHQALAALASEIGEHCQLGVRSGNDVIYTMTVRAARAAGLHFEQGNKAPLYCSSTGKLFLADMSADEFDHWLESTPRTALTRRTLIAERALRIAVASVRRDGWAASNEEMADGVVGCAVPVRLADGSLVAGLGISVPSARRSFGDLKDFRPMMERSAARIAAAIEAN